MFSRRTLLSETITVAQAAVVYGEISGLVGCKGLAVEANFTYGSAGTTAKVWIQTSLDGGTNWIDIMCFAFATTTARAVMSVVSASLVVTTPTDATLADNTAVNGVLGDRFRAKVTTVGTYAGDTTLVVNAVPKAS